MKNRRKYQAPSKTYAESTVNVNWGRLLEDNLAHWKGASQHVRGIAEYISNSDDSYRRLGRYADQKIKVEIHSKRGKQIDKLVIRDAAEGMSFEDLEGKFFQYFESYSGRSEGQEVSGQFGTGGKAYAIMNFEQCWITSVRDNIENRAWFKWDSEKKEIIKGYDNGGYRNKKVTAVNGTTVELRKCIKNNVELTKIVVDLGLLPRIRHVVKNQSVAVEVWAKALAPQLISLDYSPPDAAKAISTWSFPLPEELRNSSSSDNNLVLRYFEKPINKESFIDVSDGISTVADIDVTSRDGRPFSKYINGEMTIDKLKSSTAVKENRKGLEEGDDLTIEIETFLDKSIKAVIDEIQEKQRQKERERNIQVSNEKINQLNKFLRKCDLNFRKELIGISKTGLAGNRKIPVHQPDKIAAGYRLPVEGDFPEDILNGWWRTASGGEIFPEPGPGPNPGPPSDPSLKFYPDDSGSDTAVALEEIPDDTKRREKKSQGLVVLMSDDDRIPENDRPVLSKFEEPVSDRDLTTKGIIWINVNNPIIEKYREKEEKDELFKEAVANYVLLVVAQYQTQRVIDSQPEDERDEPLNLFRQKYFMLQRELREDHEISYYDDEEVLS